MAFNESALTFARVATEWLKRFTNIKYIDTRSDRGSTYRLNLIFLFFAVIIFCVDNFEFSNRIKPLTVSCFN